MGEFQNNSDERLTPHDTERMIRDIYEIANNAGIEEFMRSGDDDFSFSIPNVGRFRVKCLSSKKLLLPQYYVLLVFNFLILK